MSSWGVTIIACYCVTRSLHDPPPQQQQVLKKPEFNKYAHMKPPINVLTIFDLNNEAALAQTALDLLTDGGIVISTNGDFVASGVTVLDLAKGSVNGGKKTAAASSAAQGDGIDETTFGIATKLSEDDCGNTLVVAGGQKVTVFNGALPDGAKMGGKEGYGVLIRDPNAPAVAAAATAGAAWTNGSRQHALNLAQARDRKIETP